ncbi:hypothetical protein A2Z10_02640 [Candidatus Azambacteria bacterium RBG_16_47_10]|uniref:Uncharacterized protein n=1 Tax=Candidatus Azambacteria bacterium RBG_16_47_10 TaxID=1797292 RepID=A0A1F5AZM9_9BACT|nr:MAG: hypothetical protein A2Z10_02640 [Candidatus Azambacteria bacterium RBG_16_47_10]
MKRKEKALEKKITTLKQAKKTLKKYGWLSSSEEEILNNRISRLKDLLRLERLGIAEILKDFSTLRESSIH